MIYFSILNKEGDTMLPEESCLILIKELEIYIEKHMNNALKELDITATQAKTLTALLNFPGKQTTLKHLEKKLLLSQSVTVGIIKRLEQKNYVESFGDLEDKRIKIVKITPLGEQQCQCSNQILLKLEHDILSSLTKSEYLIFNKLLKKINTNK